MPKIKKITGGSIHNLPLRVTFRKRRGTKGARYLVRCGCCNESVEIYPSDKDPKTLVHIGAIEINGVNASVAQWRELLCPILGLKDPTPRV